MTIRRAAEEEREAIKAFMRANPRLSELLPRRLPCGALIERLDLECAGCAEAIDPDCAWVAIRPLELASKYVETWEAKGGCRQCRLTTPFVLRFHSGGHYDTLVRGRWRTGELDPPRRPWHQVIAEWARTRIG